MPDLNAVECRHRAEACHQIVNVTPEPKRRAIWVKRTAYWQQLALEAETKPKQSAPK
jgi:hypothetical protein